MSLEMETLERLDAGLENNFKIVQDFPRKGVSFIDISDSLVKDYGELQLRVLSDFSNFDAVDMVAGIESRGYLFASMIASVYDVGYSMIRKAGKLPPPVLGVDYQLEYGEGRIEMKIGDSCFHGWAVQKKKIVICDDVLATGGTLEAAIKLARLANYEVVGAYCLIEIPCLGAREKIKWTGVKIISSFQFEGLDENLQALWRK